MDAQKDRERPVYNLKESQLAKIYVKVLKLDPKSDSAQALLHWKIPRPGVVSLIPLVLASIASETSVCA